MKYEHFSYYVRTMNDSLRFTSFSDKALRNRELYISLIEPNIDSLSFILVLADSI